LKRINGTVKDLWYLAPRPGSGRRVTGIDIAAEDYHPVANNFFAIKDGDVDAAYVGLRQNVIGLPRDYTINVRGSFELSCDKYGATPVLFLGCQVTPQQMGDTPGALVAKDGGDIKVRGIVAGYGSMMANYGSISLYAKSALSTSPDRGIAIYAGNGIEVAADPNAKKGRADTGSMLPADWYAFKSAFNNYGGKGNMDQWLTLHPAQQAAQIGGNDARSAPDFRSVALDDTSKFWGNLTDIVTPDIAAQRAKNSWCSAQGGLLTLGQYIRLREYLKTLQAKEPDPDWLNLSTNNDEVTRLIDVQLTRYAVDAGDVRDGDRMRHVSLSEFFAFGSNPYMEKSKSDVIFRGLVYTRNGDFVFNADHKGIAIEGAVVVKNGDLRIREASFVGMMYNPAYIDKFMKSSMGVGTRLEKVLCVMY
jgi:hypothetical protein